MFVVSSRVTGSVGKKTIFREIVWVYSLRNLAQFCIISNPSQQPGDPVQARAQAPGRARRDHTNSRR